MRVVVAAVVLAWSLPAQVLDAERFRHYAEEFHAMAPEDVATLIPDSEAWAWMRANVPLFECPDRELEKTYYYRWWAFRKHIAARPGGWVITEFLKPVKHASDYNAISCALGHHLTEGRWVRDRRYVDSYLEFWLRGGEQGGLQRHMHNYSGWTAAAAYERYVADGRSDYLVAQLDALVADYELWEKDRLRADGLFWQYDVRDGMEESGSGGRKAKNARPTINSYMYGNAVALAKIARLAGRAELAARFEEKARRLRALVQERLWNAEQGFFESRLEGGELAGIREEMGFTPWYFGLPEAGRGYEVAWKELMDPRGFYTRYGPTTVEQRSPAFRIAETGDDCQWNGPGWPFSTSVTLRALARVLQTGRQNAVSEADWFRVFTDYSNSQRLKLENGREIPWVDENLNPLTGVWQARAMKIRKGRFENRGEHYNHSTFGDLLITGLVGLVPREDEVVEVKPLLPAGRWKWFCLQGVPYHGRELTVVWDETGRKYGRGKGLRVLCDGREIARAKRLERVSGPLPAGVK